MLTSSSPSFKVLLKLGLFLIPLTFFSVFYLIPMYYVVKMSFGFGFKENTFTFQHYSAIVHRDLFLIVIRFTFYQALMTVLFSLLLGLPMGFILARYKFPGKNIIRDLTTLPFILPAVVVLLGLTITYGENGWVNELFRSFVGRPLINLIGTRSGIIFAHTYYNVSLIIRVTEVGWKDVPKEEYEVARVLGANRIHRLLHIELPRVIPYIITGSLLVFLYSFNSFAIVLALGNFKYQTIEVLIYTRAAIRRKYFEATALTVILLMINLLIILTYFFIDSQLRGSEAKAKEALEESPLFYHSQSFLSRGKSILVILYTGFIVFFSIIPLFGIFLYSFTKRPANTSLLWSYERLVSDRYESLLGSSTRRLFLNSLFFGVTVMLTSIILALSIAYMISGNRSSLLGKTIGIFILLPMSTSSISLSLGMIIAYFDTPLRSDYVWVTIIAAQSLIAIPFVLRLIITSFLEIPERFHEVAQSFGANEWQRFKWIDLPLIKYGLLVSGIFSFAISLGEFGATNFLARREWQTLAIGVYKLSFTHTLSLPAAMSILLIITSFISFRLISRFGSPTFQV